MGNPRGFLEVERKEAGYRPIHDRIHDFGEVEQTLNSNDRRLQASRCMDCGVPFCHWACPLGNKPPEWNDALYRGDWQLAYELLTETNDFPEFTGRICPALCEKACVLNLMEHEPTTNREDEAAIIEHAFGEDYVKPHVPERNGKKVAVVGAGPAGLTAATRLNQKGYTVTVYDAREDAGGLLRYGIPNFKLIKSIIDRRLNLLREEGIIFEFGVKLVDSKKKSADDKGEIAANIQNDPTLGKDKTVTIDKLSADYDAVVVATGTPTARDLKIPGRDLKGVYFALEMLSQQNRKLAGQEFSRDELVNAKGKNVLVIGGGDTGSDCIGTAHRQGAKSVTQIEIMPAQLAAYAEDNVFARRGLRAPLEHQLTGVPRQGRQAHRREGSGDHMGAESRRRPSADEACQGSGDHPRRDGAPRHGLPPSATATVPCQRLRGR